MARQSRRGSLGQEIESVEGEEGSSERGFASALPRELISSDPLLSRCCLRAGGGGVRGIYGGGEESALLASSPKQHNLEPEVRQFRLLVCLMNLRFPLSRKLLLMVSENLSMEIYGLKIICRLSGKCCTTQDNNVLKSIPPLFVLSGHFLASDCSLN